MVLRNSLILSYLIITSRNWNSFVIYLGPFTVPETINVPNVGQPVFVVSQQLSQLMNVIILGWRMFPDKVYE